MSTMDSAEALDRTIQTLRVPEVYTELQTETRGLTESEAEARLARYGPNAIREVKGKPLIVKFLANFTHLMAVLLWVGGIVALVAQLPQIAIAIWMVNVINGAFSFWQEFKAEKATEALRKLLPHYVRVLRDGQEQRILAEVLIPGDIMLLAEGDHISADARLVQADELRVDQSTLTGESHPVRKTADAIMQNNLSRAEVPNLVFAGTGVAVGTGRAVVFATGMNTEFGKIANLTQSVGEEPSPLQKEIAVVTRVVTAIAVAVGVVFFVLAILLAGMTLAESFIFGMGMIVAFVPEGLLPTITLSLAMGVQRMVKRHALVKRLSGVETLGCTTVICTDKTGTLTQNEMTVRELWVGRRRLTITGAGYAPDGEILDQDRPVYETDSNLSRLLLAAAQCNDSRLIPPGGETNQWTVLGDPTEAALRVAALKGGLDLEVEARRTPRLRELPFDSRRKRMSTIHRKPGDDAQQIAYVKGAPREILALCTHIWCDGRAESLTEELRAEIMATNDDYARDGLRVLAVAERQLPDHLNRLSAYTAEIVERDLTFLGLMAMMDPPRPEVAEAVEKCHRAGIRIVMITGDYGLTAESIARRIGIIQSSHPRIITGVELEEMADDRLKEALQAEVIFARVAPEHKLRVVSALQEIGQVVAVTGDGVNDAPALKKADIGVAMGIAGTDVAKEAADMILTDDNFASIVNAIEEGRAVYANIKKFITYIFTSNTPEAVPFILFAFSGARIPLALNIMQILAIDLGTDMVPALALGTEPPEPGIMDKPPRDLRQHVITPSILLRAYPWLGMIQSLAAMSAFYFMYWTSGYNGQWTNLPDSGALYRAATTMTLAAVVATQIGNVFAQRTERTSVFRIGLFSNRLVWVGIAVEVTLIVLIVYVPFLQGIFGTAAFPSGNWLFLLAWTPALLLADELRKALLRRQEGR
jgi:potassium/sodium efflux P-type ATPase